MGPERVLVWLARVARVLAAPFVRFEIKGGACAPRLHLGVVAVNHRSMFDVVAGLIGLHHFRRYPHLLIAREYVESKWTAPFARAIGAIPVDRGSGAEGLAVALTRLSEGVPVLIMPEGRLHWDPADPVSTGPARTGVSRLATGADVVVVPVGLSGTEQVWPADARLPRLRPWRRPVVTIHVADHELTLTGDDHRANTELVMAEIRRLVAAA